MILCVDWSKVIVVYWFHLKRAALRLESLRLTSGAGGLAGVCGDGLLSRLHVGRDSDNCRKTDA